MIVVDAYRQPYVPFYLATREFFSLVRAHLEPGGIVALDVATVPGDHRLARDVAYARRWTDDRAPVEWLTDRMILEFAARGGSRSEQLFRRRPDGASLSR